MFRQRLRVGFKKEGFLRFISHHDLMRLFERALRRSGLPLKFSEGFNPRPEMSFPVALAVGVESVAEIMEFELVDWVSPDRVRRLLDGQVSAAVSITSVQSVRHGEKANVCGCEYRVRMAAAPEDFPARLGEFLASDSVVLTRSLRSGGKLIDVRRFVRTARLDGGTLVLSIDVSPAGTVRPDEVIQAILGLAPGSHAPLAVTRTRCDLSPPPSNPAEE